jgi:hypothetical protein
MFHVISFSPFTEQNPPISPSLGLFRTPTEKKKSLISFYVILARTKKGDPEVGKR